MFRILLATDGSDFSMMAAEYAAKMSRAMSDSEITVIFVKDPASHGLMSASLDIYPNPTLVTKISEQLDEIARSILHKTREALLKEGKGATFRTIWGSPPAVICDIAEKEGFDLIVVGSRGLRMSPMVIGSVTYQILTHSKVPVLVVHPSPKK